jgi:hypothetical protein
LLRSLIVRGYRRMRPWLESLEHDEMAGFATDPSGLYHFPTFLCRLIEEAARAERYRLEFGVVVFQLPFATASAPQRAELEAALRSSLRKADIPGRLSDDLLAVLLPETGRRAPEAAQRISHLLSQAAGTPISAGYARYPADSQRVSDLLRIATERCAGAEMPELVSQLEVGIGAGITRPER